MPAYSANHLIAWKPSVVTDPRLEQVVGENNFQHPWFLKKGIERSKSVGLIPRRGTAFLIRNDLIMTNWHIFRRGEWARDMVIAFDCEQDEDGFPTSLTKVKLSPSSFFYSNEELDYAIVGLENPVPDERPTIDISRHGEINLNSRVNIIQHPNAEYKKIAIRDNGIKYFDEQVLQYWTDTEHGSSGSPLFDDRWDLVGLHYMQDAATLDGGGKIFYNEGHTIQAIYSDLLQKHPNLLV